MIRECAEYCPNASLICLDHDLNPQPDFVGDPGTGLDVAVFLAGFPPVCPVLIPSSNTERVYSMCNELRFAGWVVDRVGPLGDDWIEISWQRKLKEMTGEHTNTWKPAMSTNHTPAILATGKFLTLIKEAHWEYSNRINATGAAIILAVTPEDKVLLVEQYRIPVHARTIELPAGIIGDEPGKGAESHGEAARRELHEETGYDAGRMTALTMGASCSGITSEVVTLFRATELRRTGAGGGVAHEDITVHEVPRQEIDAWLTAKAKTGVLIDPKVYAGLYFLAR